MIYNTPYIDILITISTIQLYTVSLSGHTVHHLAGVKYSTTISVAKLELQAALLGVRVATVVEAELLIQITKQYFWTDSMGVRGWVRITASYFKPFVSHRIGKIQSSTRPEEWRYIPGRLNTSDLATRSSFKVSKSSGEVLPDR